MIFDQARRAFADYQATILLIDVGAYRPQREGNDITNETRAKAERGIVDAKAILGWR